MITLKNVTKKYGRNTAVDNITLHFEKGKVYGLLGPNGSGKSTTLKLIAGLSHPNAGEIKVKGIESDRKISRYVAYLTELDTYYPNFTVKDTIDFAASQFLDFDKERAQQLVTMMALDWEKPLKELSKGNRGRLKLVTVLARNADVLLLDEPFSGLDPLVRESIVTGLLSHVDFGKQTVIIATHEIAEIEMLLDKVIAIDNGKIIAEEEVEQLREETGLSVLAWMKQTFSEMEG